MAVSSSIGAAVSSCIVAVGELLSLLLIGTSCFVCACVWRIAPGRVNQHHPERVIERVIEDSPVYSWEICRAFGC